MALEAEATVTEALGQFRAVLRVTIGQSVGERVLTADSCDALAESVAVILAMSGGASEQEEPPKAPDSPPSSPPSAVPPASSSAAPTERPQDAAPPAAATFAPRARPAPPASPSRDTRVRIAALASVDVGTLPAPALGGGLGVAVTPGYGLAFGVAGEAWAHETGLLGGSASQGASFQLLSADVTGCYAWMHRRRIELSACAIFDVSRLFAAGFGALHDSSATALWLALGAGVTARWELLRAFALSLELYGIAPTQKHSFDIASAGTIYSIGVLAFRGSLGPEVRF